MSVVAGRRPLDGIAHRVAAGVAVQVVPCAIGALHGYIQQSNRLPRLHPVAAFVHGCLDGALPSGHNAASPACHRSSHTASAGALLAAPVAQRVNNAANVARVTFGDFIQGQQAIVKHGGYTLHAVCRGAPASLVSSAAPHATCGFQCRRFAGTAVTDEMNSARFGTAPAQQWPSKCRTQRQHEHWIADCRNGYTLPPAVERSGGGVFIAVGLPRLENNRSRPGTDHHIRQGKCLESRIGPAGLHGAAHSSFGD